MKKLFSLVTLVFFAFLLVACDAEEYLAQIQELEEKVEANNNLIEGYEVVLSDKEQRIQELEEALKAFEDEIDYLEQIEDLEERLLEKKDLIDALEIEKAENEANIHILEEKLEGLEIFLDGYDGYFFITVGEEDDATTRVVRYYDDAETSLWDLLNVTFNVQSISTESGNQIIAIDDLETPFGSFIAFYINDEFAMTGVESTEYDHLDHFVFLKEWWNTDAQIAYEAIQLMLDEIIDDYLETPNYHVIVGLHRLGLLDNYTFELDETIPDTVGGLVSRIFIENALNLDNTDSTEALYEIKTSSHLYTTSIVYVALKTNPELDLDDFETNLLSAMQSQDLSETDLDTLSMMLVALSLIDDDETTDVIADILYEIENELYESDFGDNAATFSNVIIGLLSIDKNPLSVRYNSPNEESLLEVLVSFQNPDGVFNWITDPDPMFSTPQAFLALVMMQEYIASMMGQNPFIFD